MKLTIFTLLVSLFLFNCAASESVGSLSTSVNGISTSSNSILKLSDSVQSISGSLQSISGSSSGGGKSQMQVYQMDIRDLTAIYYKNGFDSEYNSDLAQVAKTNGILNWESDPSTYVGIGQGLRKAQVEESEFQIFLSKIDGSRKSLRSFLSQGYYSL